MKTKTPPASPDPAGPSLSRPQLAWTDFHTVLAVARHGSVARACVALDMTHSTLLRKLDGIESRLKTRLFDRLRGRYTLTQAGHEIAQAANAIEPLATTAETRVRGQDLRPSGDVRVAVASILVEHLLPGVLAQFASAFPEVRIELVSSRDHVSLTRREADVAIRVADQVPDWLVGRELARLAFKVYGLRQGRSRTRPSGIEELAERRSWIGFERDARELKFDRWLAANVPDASVVLRVDNFSIALTMVQAGLGIALLPAFVESLFPELLPLTEPIGELETPLWLITHPELKNTMRIKVLMRAFGPALAHAVQAAQER